MVSNPLKVSCYARAPAQMHIQAARALVPSPPPSLPSSSFFPCCLPGKDERQRGGTLPQPGCPIVCRAFFSVSLFITHIMVNYSLLTIPNQGAHLCTGQYYHYHYSSFIIIHFSSSPTRLPTCVQGIMMASLFIIIHQNPCCIVPHQGAHLCTGHHYHYP